MKGRCSMASKNLLRVSLSSAFPDYALESYEFSVVDYLLKPFSFQRFVKAVSKISNTAQSPTSISENPSFRKEIFIKSGYEHIKISVEEILYIKSDADYTEIVLPNKKHLSSESLRFWSENLNPESFLRIHKSYIINFNQLKMIEGNQIILQNEIKLPIGKSYRKEILDKIE